jgi:uncharacterized protein (DUF488 family)
MECDDWKSRYAELMRSAGRLLVARLAAIPEPYCLMCAEKRPEDCHRAYIAEYLAREQGVEVEHLV